MANEGRANDERRPKPSGMRLVVDGEKCQGHNRCHVLIPELITVDDLGFAKIEGGGSVPPALLEKARLAVRNCPEFALRLASSSGAASSTEGEAV